MDTALPVLLFVLFLAVIAGVAIYSMLAASKRRQELQRWAMGRGLRFDPEDDASFESRFPEFPCLSEGDGERYAYNVMRGPWGSVPLRAFDYHYVTHSTDSKGNRQTHHHRFSAVMIECPWPLKPLMIRPEGLLDKVAAFFGHEDINFESAEFSRKFCVKSPDKRWAYDVIHARTMAFLLTQPRYHVQFAGSRVMVWDTATFTPQEFESAIGVATGIVDRFPDYLKEQLQQGG